MKQLCLKMYLNGMGLRGIERVTEIHHTSVMHWLRDAGHQLRDAPESEEIPEVADLDELQTAVLLAFKSQEHAAANAFVGNKRNKMWKWICSQSLAIWNSGMGGRRP